MSDMKKKEVKGNYIKINVESSDYGEGYSKVEIQAFEPQDFMIASLLGIKTLANKSGIKYEDLLNLFCDLLKDKEVVEASMARIRSSQEDTLL